METSVFWNDVKQDSIKLKNLMKTSMCFTIFCASTW